MNWWQMLANDAVRKLDSNVEKGLTSFEVKKRMLKYGKNTLQAEQKNSFLKKLCYWNFARKQGRKGD